MKTIFVLSINKMKNNLILAFILFSASAFGQTYSSMFDQKITLSQWNEEAKTNIRLLPKYGYATKTETQKKADEEFIDEVLKKDTTNRKASDHLIQLGFKYLQSDVKTAMYRFNQAFLLDSTNTDIYWGFGDVYLTLGDFEKAKQQYLAGLSINPKSTHLLTDYGTYFITQYYFFQPLNEKNALLNLDSAISIMSQSYELDPTDQNTLFKLSLCYLFKKDCTNAWNFYYKCKKLGGQPITEDFTNTLIQECKRAND